MIATIGKKVPIFEIKHDNGDIEFWGFVVDKYVVIDSKHKVPFDFNPFSNRRLMP